MNDWHDRADEFTCFLALAAHSFVVGQVLEIAGTGNDYAAQRIASVNDWCTVGNKTHKELVSRDHVAVFIELVQLIRKLPWFSHREWRGCRVRSWAEQRLALRRWHCGEQNFARSRTVQWGREPDIVIRAERELPVYYIDNNSLVACEGDQAHRFLRTFVQSLEMSSCLKLEQRPRMPWRASHQRMWSRRVFTCQKVLDCPAFCDECLQHSMAGTGIEARHTRQTRKGNGGGSFGENLYQFKATYKRASRALSFCFHDEFELTYVVLSVVSCRLIAFSPIVFSSETRNMTTHAPKSFHHPLLSELT